MVYVFFAEGFEEVEALTAVDLIRRSGEKLQTVSVMGERRVTGSHGITIETDILFDEVSLPADMLVLPGGMPGTKNLGAHEGLCKLLRQQYEEEGWLAAICAAPSILAREGLLTDKKATCFPDVIDVLGDSYCDSDVVIDPPFITGRAAGVVSGFALKLVEMLRGTETAKEVASRICIPVPWRRRIIRYMP